MSNMACASQAPSIAPTSWARTYGSRTAFGNSPRSAITALTAGLKCAPLTGSEDLDQDVQAAHGRHCVGQQGDRDIAARQAFGHDP